MTNPLVEMQRLGQSPWHDNIRRELLTSGKLKKMVKDGDITGLTSNPTIFEHAIAGSTDYDDTIETLAQAGQERRPTSSTRSPIADIRRRLTCSRRCSSAPTAGMATSASRSRPRFANDTAATIKEAKRLWKDGGPAQPDGENTGDRRRRAGHRAVHRRRPEHQHHADLLARALRSGDGRLPQGAGAARGGAQEDRPHRLGRQLLRQPGGHPGGQAARSEDQGISRNSPPAAGSPEGQGRHRQRQAGLRALPRAVWQRALRRAGGSKAPACSARCGPAPPPRTRPTPTSTTSKR